MSIIFVNGQLNQKLPANSKVVFVNGEIAQTLGITPVHIEPDPEPEEEEEEVIALTALQQLAKDLTGVAKPELLLHPTVRAKLGGRL